MATLAPPAPTAPADTAMECSASSSGGLVPMPAPPERSYASREEATEACHEFVRDKGYKLVLRKPVKNTTGVTVRYYMECKRHGKLANTGKIREEDRQRKRESLRMGCPMRIVVAACQRSDPEGRWEVRYSGREGLHNHGPDEPSTFVAKSKRHLRAQAAKAAREATELGESTPDSGVGSQEPLPPAPPYGPPDSTATHVGRIPPVLVPNGANAGGDVTVAALQERIRELEQRLEQSIAAQINGNFDRLAVQVSQMVVQQLQNAQQMQNVHQPQPVHQPHNGHPPQNVHQPPNVHPLPNLHQLQNVHMQNLGSWAG